MGWEKDSGDLINWQLSQRNCQIQVVSREKSRKEDETRGKVVLRGGKRRKAACLESSLHKIVGGVKVWRAHGQGWAWMIRVTGEDAPEDQKESINAYNLC